MPVTGLEPDRIYYFVVKSQDASGNWVSSEVQSFRTKVRGHQGVPHFMYNVKVDKIDSNAITVSWRTDVNADGRIVCSKVDTADSYEVSKKKRTKKHRITLKHLEDNSDYQCSI